MHQRSKCLDIHLGKSGLSHILVQSAVDILEYHIARSPPLERRLRPGAPDPESENGRAVALTRLPLVIKGTLLGTPNREPQEYSRYIIGIYLLGSLYSIVYLLYSWGSLFGVPSRVPLVMPTQTCRSSVILTQFSRTYDTLDVQVDLGSSNGFRVA